MKPEKSGSVRSYVNEPFLTVASILCEKVLPLMLTLPSAALSISSRSVTPSSFTAVSLSESTVTVDPVEMFFNVMSPFAAASL